MSVAENRIGLKALPSWNLESHAGDGHFINTSTRCKYSIVIKIRIVKKKSARCCEIDQFQEVRESFPEKAVTKLIPDGL